MSMISEQVKELRKQAFEHKWGTNAKMSNFLKQAADTIEELSAKIAAANTERSEAYYRGGWIYCGDGNNLPQECGYYLVTVELERENRIMKLYFSKESNGFTGYGKSVIAWMHLPEPFFRKSTD